MGHTSDQRSANALCGALTKRGVRCRAFAGQGTDHFGAGRCKFHLGATANGRKHAIAIEAQQRMVAMSLPIENAQPHAVLLSELAYSAGHCQWLRSEITQLDPEQIGDARSVVLLSRLDSERDRVTRIAQAAASAGVDEAMIQIQQAQAVQMVRAITDAAKDAGIPSEYVRALGPALRRQFALAAGDDEAAEAQEGKLAEIRAKIASAEAKRAEKAAQRYSGLTFPPDELVVEPREAH